MMTNLNLLAIAACVLSSFILGGLWYNILFRKFYSEECKGNKPSHPALVFLAAFILWIISAFAFAKFLGNSPELWAAISIGFITGSCLVATSFGVNYAFSSKKLSIFLIDAGYHILQFTLYGVILGLWH
ncbi:MAG: DUF1761 domain-containing protein [Gammaproteobacteria bacterium]|nr:DUF1761 domain-containing protein [Gammaproteobacteria bacterium]